MLEPCIISSVRSLVFLSSRQIPLFYLIHQYFLRLDFPSYLASLDLASPFNGKYPFVKVLGSHISGEELDMLRQYLRADMIGWLFWESAKPRNLCKLLD